MFMPYEDSMRGCWGFAVFYNSVVSASNAAEGHDTFTALTVSNQISIDIGNLQRS